MVLSYYKFTIASLDLDTHTVEMLFSPSSKCPISFPGPLTHDTPLPMWGEAENPGLYISGIKTVEYWQFINL